MTVSLHRSLGLVGDSGSARFASLFANQPYRSPYTYSTGNMQLMSAENSRSHMFDVSSKPREGICGKTMNKETGRLFLTAACIPCPSSHCWTSTENCSPSESLSLSHSLLGNGENRRASEKSDQREWDNIIFSSNWPVFDLGL